MSRMVFSEVVGTMSFLRPQCDDDSVDRLHYYYTTTFLLVFAVLISLKMFGGSPIECWLPAEFRPSWQEYTELICWSMSTYFVRGALGGTGPNGKQQLLKEPMEADRRHQTIAYYQWTPFFLVFSAILFYSPCVVWRKLSAKSGLILNEIVAFAMAVDKCPPTVNNLAARNAKLRGIAAHLRKVYLILNSQTKYTQNWIELVKMDALNGSAFRHRSRRQNSISRPICYFWPFWGEQMRFHSSYLASLYMAIKLLFLVIVLLQAILMNRFLQTDSYDFYGFGVLLDLLHGREWSDSGFFPRIAFCDIDVRILGAVQKYTVQCILVINIFTEKVFVLLWCWYSLLLIITVFNGLEWLMAILSFQARREFVLRRLKLADMQFEEVEAKSAHKIDQFIDDFLKIDGCFVLRMLDVHTGEWVCAEILDLIWEEYCGNSNNNEKATEAKLKSDKSEKKDNEKDRTSPSESDCGELPKKERKSKPKRLSKKCRLLQPLVARPTPAEEEQLRFGWATSMPNLFNSPAIHRAMPPSFPHSSPPSYPLKTKIGPIASRRPTFRRAESEEGTMLRRHRLRPSNSFDQPSSAENWPLDEGEERPTKFVGLRKHSDIFEEEEEMENGE